MYANNVGTTGVVAVGGSITSEIDTIGDKDWFAVDLVAGNDYRFTMTTEALSDLGSLYFFGIEGLIGPDGDFIAKGDQSPGYSGLPAEITYKALVSGRYFVPLRGAPEGLDTPDAQRVGGYQLDVTQIIDTDDHGGTPATATPLTVGQAATGRINDDPQENFVDEDWFSVDLEAGQIIHVDLSYQAEIQNPTSYLSSSMEAPVLYTLDEETGALLQYFEGAPPYSSNYDKGSTIAEEAGRYYIKLTGKYASDYRLEVSSPWQFDAAQIAQYSETGWPEFISGDMLNLSTQYHGRHAFVSLGAEDQIIKSAGLKATLIGGGGRDVLLGSEKFDLLIGETGTTLNRLQAEFEINALYKILQGRSIEPEGREARLIQEMDAGLSDGNPQAFALIWAQRILGHQPYYDNGELVKSNGFFENNGFYAQKYLSDDDDKETHIRALYEGLRGEQPTDRELNHWMEYTGNHTDMAALAGLFARSFEAFGKFATEIIPDIIDTADAGDVALIYSAYQNLLYRAPDITGMTGWSDMLSQGAELEDIITGILKSREYFIKHKQAIMDDPQPLETMLANAMSRLETPGAETFNTWMRDNAADDVLVAGGGNDLLVGGILSDTFVFDKGDDFNRVLDFEAWDRLDLRAFDFASADDALAAFYAQDGKAVFNEEGTVIVLYDTDPDMLSTDTFLI